jgi:hypothetical protein
MMSFLLPESGVWPPSGPINSRYLHRRDTRFGVIGVKDDKIWVLRVQIDASTTWAEPAGIGLEYFSAAPIGEIFSVGVQIWASYGLRSPHHGFIGALQATAA